MFVQVTSLQSGKAVASPVGLSDPLKAVDAISSLKENIAAMNYTLDVSNDFDALAELRQRTRQSRVSPMFDPAVNRHLSERAFWISTIGPDGEVVGVQAFRLDEADPNLAEWVLGWMMGLYAKRQELVIPAAPHVPDHSVTTLIKGPIAYHGELWIDNRHKGLLDSFSRLGMLLALIKWQPEALWCLGNKGMATRGHFVRGGYVHIERSFLRWNWEPSGAEPVEWIGIAERRHLEFLIAEMTSKDVPARESKSQPSSLP